MTEHKPAPRSPSPWSGSRHETQHRWQLDGARRWRRSRSPQASRPPPRSGGGYECSTSRRCLRLLRPQVSERVQRALPRTDLTALIQRLRTAGCVFAEEEVAALAQATPDPQHLEQLVRQRETGEPLEHRPARASSTGTSAARGMRWNGADRKHRGPCGPRSGDTRQHRMPVC